MSLFALGPATGPRWHIGVQSGLSVSLPIIVMAILGLPQLGYIAASGAFVVLYASTLPAVERVRVLPVIAGGLIVSAALGAVAGANPWLVSVGIVVVAIAAALFTFGCRIGPPGPLFFVLVFGLSAQIVGLGVMEPVAYVGTFAAGCAFAYAIAAATLLLPAVRSVRARPFVDLLPKPTLDADGRTLVVRVALVAVAGVLIGLVVDPDRSYWVVGAAVAVVGAAAARRAAFQRGLHRALGTIAGTALYALLALLHPAGIWLALLLGVLQFSIELVVARHYALALVLITPLVLLLTGAATGDIGSLSVALERVIDTLVGAALGAASGLLHRPTTSRAAERS